MRPVSLRGKFLLVKGEKLASTPGEGILKIRTLPPNSPLASPKVAQSGLPDTDHRHSGKDGEKGFHQVMDRPLGSLLRVHPIGPVSHLLRNNYLSGTPRTDRYLLIVSSC